ncbi:MAG: ice-binding family protein [Thermoplasmataceae archaeon]
MRDRKNYLSKINVVSAIVISLVFILSSSAFVLGQTQNNSNLLSSPTIVASYDVNFTETGLSSGTQWNVTLNNVSEISTSSEIVFSMPNGAYAYNVANISGFTSSPSSGNITVSGSNFKQAISFNALPPVLLSPVDLGTAGNFAVLAETAVTNTGTSSITGNVGLSPAAASYFTGFSQTLNSSGQFSTSSYVTGDMYAANYASPTPTMLTAAVNDMHTAYTNAQGRTDPGYINLGAGNVNGMTLLPGLYKWSTGLLVPTTVTLKGNASSVWIFQIAGSLTVGNGAKMVLTGGALPQNIFWSVASGVSLGTGVQFSGNILSQTAITVATGASLNGRALAQTAVTLQGNNITAPSSTSVPVTEYNVIFTESGLSSGTSWNVTLGNVIKTSTTDTITFNEVNGTYSFSVASNSTDKILPSKGNVTVNGASSYQAITFAGLNQDTYEVTFIETGLSTGTVFNVALNGTTTSSSDTTIAFFEINGTYSYSIGSVSGYTVSPSSGNITVNGKNVSQNITFTTTSTPSPAKPSSSGISSTELYLIVGVVIAAAIGTVAAIMMRKRK